MKRTLWATLILAVFAAGCASIISGTKQEVSVGSTPPGATVTFKTTGGMTVFTGTTPASCRLPRSDNYLVVIKMDGYKDQEIYINRDFNGWFIGNLLCGGLIGMVVDAVDGAMWNLAPDQIHVELAKTLTDGRISTYAVVGAVDDHGQLRTISIPMIPVTR